MPKVNTQAMQALQQQAQPNPPSDGDATPTPSVDDIPDLSGGDSSEGLDLSALIEQNLNPPAEDPKPPVEDPKPPAEDPKPPAEDLKPPVEDPKPPVEDTKPEGEEGDKKKSDDPLDNLDLGDELPEDFDKWTPKQAEAFKRIKGERSTIAAENQRTIQENLELQRQLDEAKAQLGDDTRETMQERLKKYEQEQMVSNLEASQPYQDAVTKPLNEIAERAGVLAEKYGVNHNDLINAMADTDEKRQSETISTLLADATDRDKARIYSMIDEVPAILKRRDELRENVAEATKEAELLKEQEEQRILAEAVESRKISAKNVADRIKSKLPFLSAIEGVDLDQFQNDVADVDISTANPVDQVYAGMTSKLFPKVIQAYLKMEKENEALTSELANYSKAEPKISGGDSAKTSTKSGQPQTDADDDDADFLANVEKNLASQS